MRIGLISGMALTAALYGAAAGAQDFQASLFRGHRAAAVKAVNAGEFATAESEIAAARDMVPSAPSVLLLGAQIEVAAGKPEAAKSWLADYIRRGLWFDAARYPNLVALLDDAARTQLAANGADFGTFDTIARIDDLWLVEGVAEDGGHLYLSSVHAGALNALDDKTLRTIHSLPSGLGGYGLAARNGTAWMAVSPGEVSGQGTAGQRAGVIEVALATGAVKAQVDAELPPRSLGDIALGRRDLYASDGKSGEVLQLKGRAAPWHVLIPAGRLGSAQGLAESADGKSLIVADYTSGLYRIDLASGQVSPLPVPETASLVGVDGVTRFGNDLIVVQNGIQPPRVLRVRMSKGWKSIDSVEVLLRGGALDEPTGGQATGNRYVFVARSQWPDFTDNGAPKPEHGPAIIGEIKLQP